MPSDPPASYGCVWSHPSLSGFFKAHCATWHGDTFHVLKNAGKTIACPLSQLWWILLLRVVFCLFLDDQWTTYISHVCILFSHSQVLAFILLVLCFFLVYNLSSQKLNILVHVLWKFYTESSCSNLWVEKYINYKYNLRFNSLTFCFL